WRSAEVLPWVGPNFTAIRELAATADEVGRHAIAPVVTLAGQLSLSGFRPVDGRFDLAPMVSAQPALDSASAALDRVGGQGGR
ncbi:hypothetical protein ACC691_40480, partial [Rhizobium johnstonii]|uniref:hypothetical protein n=1 Tax=Rhizobium johnstonii TaxID=3019933 RepID=UPI003F9462D7